MTEAEILRAVQREHIPGVRLWRANLGAARNPRGRLVRFGVPGSADLTGILEGSGRRIEIEVKRPGGKQTEPQRNFQRLIERYGGIYLLVHSLDEYRTLIHAVTATRGDI